MPTLPTTPERDWETELLDILPIGLDDWIVDEIKKFISTELSAQATKLLGEVEKMIGEDEDPYKGIEMVSVVKTRNEHRQELRTKLVSLRSKWERSK